MMGAAAMSGACASVSRAVRATLWSRNQPQVEGTLIGQVQRNAPRQSHEVSMSAKWRPTSGLLPTHGTS
jgi:hypothetical protein